MKNKKKIIKAKETLKKVKEIIVDVEKETDAMVKVNKIFSVMKPQDVEKEVMKNVLLRVIATSFSEELVSVSKEHKRDSEQFLNGLILSMASVVMIYNKAKKIK